MVSTILDPVTHLGVALMLGGSKGQSVASDAIDAAAEAGDGHLDEKVAALRKLRDELAEMALEGSTADRVLTELNERLEALGHSAVGSGFRR